MRPASISTCALFLFACGGEPPISIQTFDLESPCLWPVTPEVPPDTDPATVQFFRATRQMLEFNVAFAVQQANLLTRPVLDDPTADSWDLELERGRIQGAVLARGDDWSVLEMIAIVDDPFGSNEPGSLRAEIHNTPNRTTYELEGGTIFDVRPHSFRLHDYIRGCDPGLRMQFELGPTLMKDGTIENRARCWDWSGAPTAGGGGIAIPGENGADEAAAHEFELSFELRCQQLIAKNQLPY